METTTGSSAQSTKIDKTSATISLEDVSSTAISLASETTIVDSSEKTTNIDKTSYLITSAGNLEKTSDEPILFNTTIKETETETTSVIDTTPKSEIPTTTNPLIYTTNNFNTITTNINSLYDKLIFNCNFDSSSIITQQCGGAANVNIPLVSGPTFSAVSSDVVPGVTPTLTVTDYLSISKQL